MQENDARRLDHHTLEALRERAVRKVQEGESPEVVARVLGLNRSTVYGWLAQQLCVLEVVSGRPRAARKTDLLLAQFGLDQIARQIAAGTPQIDLKACLGLPDSTHCNGVFDTDERQGRGNPRREKARRAPKQSA
jgi:Helix-turn-helix domain